MKWCRFISTEAKIREIMACLQLFFHDEKQCKQALNL